MRPPPDLAQSYRERPPTSTTAPFLSCVWIQQVSATSNPYAHRTVPNGAVEISWPVGSDGVAVTGPRPDPVVATLAPGTTIVGVRFRPGAASPILGVPASELAGTRVGVDRLWGRRAAELADRLAVAASPEAAAAVLEGAVADRVSTADTLDPMVEQTVRRLQPGTGSGLAALNSLSISARQLRRRCLAALGFGPKTLHRVLRFQGFLALADAVGDAPGGLARLAASTGFADQAHLTRECVRLSGLTPAALLSERHRSCGPTHDHAASFAAVRRALGVDDRSVQDPGPAPP